MDGEETDTFESFPMKQSQENKGGFADLNYQDNTLGFFILRITVIVSG